MLFFACLSLSLAQSPMDQGRASGLKDACRNQCQEVYNQDKDGYSKQLCDWRCEGDYYHHISGSQEMNSFQNSMDDQVDDSWNNFENFRRSRRMKSRGIDRTYRAPSPTPHRKQRGSSSDRKYRATSPDDSSDDMFTNVGKQYFTGYSTK